MPPPHARRDSPPDVANASHSTS